MNMFHQQQHQLDRQMSSEANNNKDYLIYKPNTTTSLTSSSPLSSTPSSSSKSSPINISINNNNSNNSSTNSTTNLNSPVVLINHQYSINTNSNSSCSSSNQGDSSTTTNNNDSNNNSNSKSLSQKVRKKSTFPFGKCKVCNDKATGVHYGISTCEGCKGFFKRSILRNEYYKCFFGNNCVLNPKNRNRCKACRFKKCIQAGMSFSGIKMGRIPKAEKIKAIENLKTTGEEVEEEEYEEEEDEEDTQSTSNYNKRYEMRKELENNLASLTNNILKSSITTPTSNHSNSNSNLNFIGAENSKLNSSNNSIKSTDENDENLNSQNDDDNININNNNNNSDEDEQDEYRYNTVSNNISQTEDTSNNSMALVIPKKRYLNGIVTALGENFNATNNATNDKNNNNNTTTNTTTTTTSTTTTTTTTNSSSNSNKAKLNKYEDYMTKFLKVLETSEEFEVNQSHLNHQLIQARSTDIFMKNLLDLHKPLKSSNILPKTNYSNMFSSSFNQNDLSYHIISSLINDKIYQLYNTHSEDTYNVYEKAKQIIARGDVGILGDNSPDLTLDKVWTNLVQSIPAFVKSVILFAKEVPGLNELNEVDFATIINNKLFDFFVIMNSILFINGESYLYIPNNIHYTRYWMNRIKGKATTDALFDFVQELNSLSLTNKEKALLIVLVFTMPDLDIQDPINLQDLNEYYTRSILYEFDLNKRNTTFLSKFKKILIKLKENRILQKME